MTSNRAREGLLGKATDLLPYIPIVIAAAIFYGAGLRRTGGAFPVPLDDTFIHFDFARATAEGHPFEWIAGQGYSSGETAVLYPFALATGYLIGFRDGSLAIFAAMLALASLAVFASALFRVGPRIPIYARALACSMIVVGGVVDWSLFSGMETALFTGVLGLAMLAVARSIAKAAPTVGSRCRSQRTAGGLFALLVLLRPEAVVVVFAFAVLVGHAAKDRSAIAAMARIAAPAALVTLAFLGANYAFEGHASAAGAKLKLLSEQPFLTDEARAREFAQNLLFFKWKVVDAAFNALPGGGTLWLGLATVATFAKSTRGVARALLSAAFLWTLLVSWNSAARYQNFRYYAPPLLFFQITAALGVVACIDRLSNASRAKQVAFTVIPLLAIATASPRLLSEADRFARAARNIREQQVEVGLRLARGTTTDARILVGDAGAIPYFSRRTSIDALGLGGYRRMPFVLAANHGEAAVLELIERLPASERPTHLALYPNWFPRLTARFGHEIDHVTISDNVICGGPTKGIYVADWSALALAPSREHSVALVEELDVADVISERAHRFVSAAPSGGFTEATIAKTRNGRDRFDGGRLIPEGASETFWISTRAEAIGGTPLAVIARVIDDSGSPVLIVGDDGPKSFDIFAAPAAGRWGYRVATIDASQLRAELRLRVRADRGSFHSFHYFVVERDRVAEIIEQLDE